MEQRDIEEKEKIYKALRDLVYCLDSGGLIYVEKQGEGYTDIRALVSDETMAWIRHDIIGCLNVETIAIRREILMSGHLLNRSGGCSSGDHPGGGGLSGQ